MVAVPFAPLASAAIEKGATALPKPSMSSVTTNVPVIGIVENMAYFTPSELPENKYYIFGKEGAKTLSEQMNIDLLGEIPLVQSVREAADIGRPAVLQGSSKVAIALYDLAKRVIENVEKRNIELEKTKTVELTNKVGCSAK